MACATLALAACQDGSPSVPNPEQQELVCSVPQSQIFRGALRGAIPALSDPELAFPGWPDTELWRPTDRVVGIAMGEEAVAIPMNIFWWHEIVNLTIDGIDVAITHCPLTGSTLAFDRTPLDGVEFQVSDLSGAEESLWPQMARGARCGPRDGASLSMLAVTEMTYEGWQRLYPFTQVLTTEQGHDREYDRYPYFDYDSPSNDWLLYPIPGEIDERRPPKERVLGIPLEEGGHAFPFGELAESGDIAVVPGMDGLDYVVFWDGEYESAMAYWATAPGGVELTFHVDGDRIVDDQTGSEWSVVGRAIDGPMTGTELEPVSDAFVAFWFAWPLFYPDIQIWGAS
jgi:hypothetical protein